MKYCPHCHGQYSDELAFCDLDGTPLVDGGRDLAKNPGNRRAVQTVSAPPAAVFAVIGVLIGIALCVAVYIAFLRPGLNLRESSNQDRETSSASATPAVNKQISARPAPSPSLTNEESPAPEEPGPSTEATPAAAKETSAKTPVNQGPISTGTMKTGEGRTLITMKDGSSIEADAAWEDSEGIWYRRSGLVSFVERAKVQKISELSSRPTQDPKP